MRSHIALLSIAIVTMPLTAYAEDAHSILKKQQEMQIQRWKGVNTYVVVQTVMGNKVNLAFERGEIKGADGKTYPVFQRVQAGSGQDDATKAMMSEYGNAAEALGDGMANEIEDGLEQAGLPRGLLKATGGDPWASLDPRVMMGGMATFSRAAAEGDPNQSDPAADAAATVNGLAAFAERARLAGTENVDGKPAFHLIAEGLNQVQKADGQEFKLDTVHMWIDTTAYVPLKMRTEGIATANGESRPITIEKTDSDYRNVAGSSMYEPYRSVMHMAGMMTPEQQQEMQKAQAQMADMEKQLAEMPAAQRQMVMRQMGPQMDMMRSMAAGGGMEMVTVVDRILVNPKPGDQGSVSTSQPGAVEQSQAVLAPSSATSPATAPSETAPRELQAARQACLDQKVQSAQQSKKGIGKLFGAARNLAKDVTSSISGSDSSQVVSDVYSPDATDADVAAAARSLGISPEDIEACRTPG
ncbi:MAG: hypothetical protein R3F24_14215 [Gammaproteobacteria bacterium]